MRNRISRRQAEAIAETEVRPTAIAIVSEDGTRESIAQYSKRKGYDPERVKFVIAARTTELPEQFWRLTNEIIRVLGDGRILTTESDVKKLPKRYRAMHRHPDFVMALYWLNQASAMHSRYEELADKLMTAEQAFYGS